MTTAREVMTAGAECARAEETLLQAAQRMRELDVGALPICGEDNQLHGVLTDRDIVVRCVADGEDPSSTDVGSFAGEKPVTIGADDDVEEALQTMIEHGVRRLPVIDGHQLVGMVSQADLARELPAAQVGQLVGAISSKSGNSGMTDRP